MTQGTQVHVAAWPGQNTGTSRHLFLSQAFASQAGAYVIDAGALLSKSILGDAYDEFVNGIPERLVDSLANYPGESCIIGPRGDVIAGPAEGRAILVADCTSEDIYSAKALCDVAGHYSRPDIFTVYLDRTPYRNQTDTDDSGITDEHVGDGEID